MARRPLKKVLMVIRNQFLAGMLVTAPLALTVIILVFLFDTLDGILAPVLTRHLGEYYFKGFGLFLLFLIIWLVGILTSNLFIKQIVGLYEKILQNIPIAKNIFGALKQISDTVFSGKNKSFSKVVLIALKPIGLNAIGFLTSDDESVIASGISKKRVIHVFIPTTPNPTSGFLFLVPVNSIKILDIPVETAFKTIISLGMVHPSRYSAIKAVKALKKKTKKPKK